ncbi:unnamed protein product, partial [Ectocarpus sp. 8 AP-2014]
GESLLLHSIFFFFAVFAVKKVFLSLGRILNFAQGKEENVVGKSDRVVVFRVQRVDNFRRFPCVCVRFPFRSRMGGGETARVLVQILIFSNECWGQDAGRMKNVRA